jgi:hypothetical protein
MSVSGTPCKLNATMSKTGTVKVTDIETLRLKNEVKELKTQLKTEISKKMVVEKNLEDQKKEVEK